MGALAVVAVTVTVTTTTIATTVTTTNIAATTIAFTVATTAIATTFTVATCTAKAVVLRMPDFGQNPRSVARREERGNREREQSVVLPSQAQRSPLKI